MDKYADLIANASRLVATALLEGETDLESRALTLDADVWELLRQVGLAVMSSLFAELGRRTVLRAEAQGLKVNRHTLATFSVVFGPVEIQSPYLWDAKTKRSCRPVQDELGLVNRGRSPAVVRAMTDFGAEESFGQASVRFKEHYGWEIGRTSILRVVEDVAREVEGYVANRLASSRAEFDKPLAERPGCEQVLVELDGSELRTGTLQPKAGRERTPVHHRKRRRRVEEWRDVRVGFARRLDQTERTYVARLDTYDRLGDDLFSAAVDRGLSSATRVTAVADGGNGLREGLVAKFPNLRFILDRPHLKGHFFETAEALGYSGVRAEAWVDKHMHDIDEGYVGDTLAQLRFQQRRRRNKRLRRLIGYVKRFRDAVHYAAFIAQGLPIGSGEVESAHRTIPQKRMKISGACWHPRTINPMLALRTLRANHWWDDFWAKREDRSAA